MYSKSNLWGDPYEAHAGELIVLKKKVGTKNSRAVEFENGFNPYIPYRVLTAHTGTQITHSFWKIWVALMIIFWRRIPNHSKQKGIPNTTAGDSVHVSAPRKFSRYIYLFCNLPSCPSAFWSPKMIEIEHEEHFHGYAALESGMTLSPFSYPAHPLSADDVEIKINYCGKDLFLISKILSTSVFIY